MKAAQARIQAISIASKEAAEKSAALKKRRAALKASVPRIRAERIAKIEERFRSFIKYAVEDGQRYMSVILSSDGRDVLRGAYKYLPTKTTKDYYGNSHYSWSHAWGKGYLKFAPWGKYVKIVLAKLKRDGYKCEISGESTEHDDSAAYMNSGGECGSETPYHTRDTVLKISW